jgi:GxxExxY protein
MEDIMKLCDVVRETGFAIHRYHKHGHLEKVYENALAHRLRKLGLDVKQQHAHKVYDEDGTLIGDYNADLFVDNRLIIELKAAKALADEHGAQILGYLRASRVEPGLLINFGAPKFEIKKYALSRIGEVSRSGSLIGGVLSLEGEAALRPRGGNLHPRTGLAREPETAATTGRRAGLPPANLQSQGTDALDSLLDAARQGAGTAPTPGPGVSRPARRTGSLRLTPLAVDIDPVDLT